MPYLANLDLVEVRGKYVRMKQATGPSDTPGEPATPGTIRFRASTVLTDAATTEIVLPVEFTAQLDSEGEFTVWLPACDDPDLEPQGWTYSVTETIGNQQTVRAQWNLFVPLAAQAQGIDLALVAPVTDPPPVGEPWFPQPHIESEWAGTNGDQLRLIINGEPGPLSDPITEGGGGGGGTGADGVSLEFDIDNENNRIGVKREDEQDFTYTDPLTGPSAYDIAVAEGFVGNEQAWLASLEGPEGPAGAEGPSGPSGSDGDSAYQVAVNEGFVGTTQAWLDSLVGLGLEYDVDGDTIGVRQEGETEYTYTDPLTGDPGIVVLDHENDTVPPNSEGKLIFAKELAE